MRRHSESMRVAQALVRREGRRRRGRRVTPARIWRGFIDAGDKEVNTIFDIVAIGVIIVFFGGLIWWSR